MLMESNGSTPIYLTCDTLSSAIARREMLSHGQIMYGNTCMLVKSINEDAISPPCTGKGFPNFKEAYIDKDHADHVVKRLTTSGCEK
jgi:hypothetical protein